MQVVHVCMSRSQGGLELSVPKFAKATQNLGYQTWIVAPRNSLIEEKSHLLGFKVLHSIFTLFRRIDGSKKTIVIFHKSHDVKWAFWLKLFFKNLRSIYVTHMFIGINKKDFYHTLTYRAIDHVIAFTETQRNNHLEHLPIDARKISWLWHGIYLTSFEPPKSRALAKKQIHYNRAEFLLGCVGRFDPQKGQMLLVKACHILKQKGIGFHLILIGRDSFEEEGTLARVKYYVTQNQLENDITFLDYTSNLKDYFQAFDLFVLPSDQETYGLVLVEAMLCGALTMAFEKGGPIDILDKGRAGILVKSSKDPQVLSDAIAEVIQNFDRYHEVARQGTERAKKISDPKKFELNLRAVIEKV